MGLEWAVGAVGVETLSWISGQKNVCALSVCVLKNANAINPHTIFNMASKSFQIQNKNKRKSNKLHKL